MIDEKDEKIVKLLAQIEMLRGKLDKYAYYRDLTSDKIISIGHQMNKLLNSYYGILNGLPLRKRSNQKLQLPKKGNIRSLPYETPYPIIVKSGNEEYILIKLFENENIRGIKL